MQSCTLTQAVVLQTGGTGGNGLPPKGWRSCYGASDDDDNDKKEAACCDGDGTALAGAVGKSAIFLAAGVVITALCEAVVAPHSSKPGVNHAAKHVATVAAMTLLSINLINPASTSAAAAAHDADYLHDGTTAVSPVPGDVTLGARPVAHATATLTEEELELLSPKQYRIREYVYIK
eukprot:jgi/Chrzof1/13397/Cz07g31150.t1